MLKTYRYSRLTISASSSSGVTTGSKRATTRPGVSVSSSWKRSYAEIADDTKEFLIFVVQTNLNDDRHEKTSPVGTRPRRRGLRKSSTRDCRARIHRQCRRGARERRKHRPEPVPMDPGAPGFRGQGRCHHHHDSPAYRPLAAHLLSFPQRQRPGPAAADGGEVLQLRGQDRLHPEPPALRPVRHRDVSGQ